MIKTIEYIADIALLRNAERTSSQNKFLRFILLAISTFFTYSLLLGLKEISFTQLNLIVDNILDPPWLLVAVIFSTMALISLWLSLISVTLFNSLLPKI